jgi:hypothetical protein
MPQGGELGGGAGGADIAVVRMGAEGYYMQFAIGILRGQKRCEQEAQHGYS